MGGTKEGTKEGRTAAYSIVAALALVLGGPASAAADGPLDAGALQTIQQQAAAVVAPTAKQTGAIVKNATGVVSPAIVPKPVPKPHAVAVPDASPQAEVAPGNGTSTHVAVTGPRLALAGTAPRSAAAENPHPPPHGHEALPAARSHPGRARVASSHSKLAIDTSAARAASTDPAPAAPPPAPWKPHNPLLGLGRPVRNAGALIELGWILTVLAGGCLGGRAMLRRLRTGAS